MQTSHSYPESSSEMSLPKEGNDAKYVSGLSTILVATIQEAKDRISQVEYIFCNQLYPNFQKNSKCAEKLYSEARAVAEDEWKGRVSDLMSQLSDVCVEKEQAVKECKAVKIENLKLLERITEVAEMLTTKTKEVDEGLRYHAKLDELVESKSSVIISNEKQLKEQEEKMNSLLETIMNLSTSLQEKNEEINKGKVLEEELVRKIDTQTLTISNYEHMLSNSEKEKKCLQNELNRKIAEVQEANRLQEQLIEQTNRNEKELAKRDLQLSACEKEKQVLLSRIVNLENKVEECQDKAKQLERESQKRRDTVTAYKLLKFQQIFLLKKLGLTTEEMLLQIKAEEGRDQLSKDNRTSTPLETNAKNPVSNVLGAELSSVKKEADSTENYVLGAELSKVKKEADSMENSDDELSGQLNQMSNSRPPPVSTSPLRTNWTTKKVPTLSAGIKRPAPGWRETRSRPSPGGADPHDDFLDTPYDNIRGNLIKAVQEHQHSETVSDSSDDETQDTRPRPAPDKQVQKSQRIGPKDFKFVEPVRKKAERENLNGIECRQCKKFYDAVLGDGEGKEQNLRCEHHDGVSRHRYRYVPPMTPEGFWNIGFDTEN